MRQTWSQFKSDRLFLTKYLMLHSFFIAFLSVLLFHYRGLNLHLNLNFSYLWLLPCALILGIKVPVLMHNCMHGNLSGPRMNFWCGELSSFFALMSLGILRINHTLHHIHADTHDDPHNPSNKKFVTFFFVSQMTGARVIQERFLEFHGRTLKNRIIFKFNVLLHYSAHIQRLLLWTLILGPNVFVALYVPSFIVYSLAFAHVNYITHSTNEFGMVEVVNKDHNLYYRFINFIGDGVYYHKNHHRYPNLINPQYIPSNKVVL